MLGFSGVVAIVTGLAKGQKMEQLQLAEFPNMPFLYWLAVASAIIKPKWTDSKTWPALKVTTTICVAVCAESLSNLCALFAGRD